MLSIDKEVFNPSEGERLTMRFRLASLTESAKVSIKIFDFDQRLISSLCEEKLMAAGDHTIVWNGRDRDGRVVPDEAYFCTLEARQGPHRVVYDPTAVSGGVSHEIERVNILAQTQQLEYTLPESGRVSIRAGIVDGPLLAVPVDWEPRVKGVHREHWDGMDQERLIPVLKHPRYQIRANYFTLPENTIITRGNKATDYYRYRQSFTTPGLKKPQASPGPGSILSSPLFSKPIIFSKAPAIEVTFPQSQVENGVPRLEKKFMVKTDFQEPWKAELRHLPYEIYFFLDGKYLIEIPVVKLPYEKLLEVGDQSPGFHVLTVNIKEIGGQIGIKSTKVKLQ